MIINKKSPPKGGLYTFTLKEYLFLFEELEELIQLRQDNDAGAAVSGAAFFGIIAGCGHIFATAGRGNMGGVEAILLLQDTDDGSCTLDAKIPVVLQDAGMVVRLVVCIAFHHKFDIGLRLQHGRYFAEYDFSGFRDIPFAAGEQQLVGNINVDDPFVDLDIDVLIIYVCKGALEVRHQSQVQGIFVRQFSLEVLDVGILGPDVVQRFLDAFCLRVGDNRKILQLLESSIMILLQEVDLLVQRVDLGLKGGGFGGI